MSYLRGTDSNVPITIINIFLLKGLSYFYYTSFIAITFRKCRLSIQLAWTEDKYWQHEAYGFCQEGKRVTV